MSWKPETYASLSPYLIVEGAEATIAFLKATFGAVELRRFSRGDPAALRTRLTVRPDILPNVRPLHHLIGDRTCPILL